MGRKSIANKIIEALPEEEDDSRWVICYDFTTGSPIHRFYRNRNRIISRLGGIMVQYSVFLGSKKSADAVTELARRYGAHVSRFRVVEENLDFV